MKLSPLLRSIRFLSAHARHSGPASLTSRPAVRIRRRLALCSLFPLCASFGAEAVSPTPGEVVRLSTFVVSAGLEDRAAFDLAQGTSILAGEELARSIAAGLAESLQRSPGVNASSFGPGASRPVIRGLGGDRVRVLSNGVGSLDASSVSPDHDTSLEPLFASQIEVLRGPATLLYGGSAVGGAVNVIDNSIPSARSGAPFSGAVELRGLGAGEERTGVAALTFGLGEEAIQLNLLDRRTSDLEIPGIARIDADAPADQPSGVLPNSAVRSRSGSIGASRFFSDGHVGIALSTHSNEYGVPVDEPISIELQQRRVDLEAEHRAEAGIYRGFRIRAGLGDYEHSEIADRTTVTTTFQNDAWEARFELPHSFGERSSGVLAAHSSRSDFSAMGEEVVAPPYVTTTHALFGLEEWAFEGWTLQGGARVERQTIKLGEVDPDLPAVPGYAAQSGERHAGTAVSTSIGIVYYPAEDWSIGASISRNVRLPTAQERFSNGPHGGTGSWEVGTAALPKEESTGLDLSVRRRSGAITGSVGVFMNRFRNYVYEERLPDLTIPADVNDGGLAEYQYVARNAKFSGVEAELTVHLLERGAQRLHLDLSGDLVRARQTTQNVFLPRTPPVRFGVGLAFEDSRWRLNLEVRRTESQTRVAPGEVTSPGTTELNAGASLRVQLGETTAQLFIRGTNLTNREIRDHISFLREFSPAPGRSITAGARFLF